MTREEIIHGLYRGDSKAIKEAIKTLEQEPCEDAISRADAVKVASGYCNPANIAEELAKLPPVQPKPKVGCTCDQIKWERDMAIAQLNELGYGLGEKQKTGHWIEIGQYSDGKHKIECSECKSYIVDRGHANSFNVKNKYKYCPNCGAKMVEVES